VVEQVCIDAGLKRIFHDIDGWINIPADDPAHMSLILESGGYIGYDNKSFISSTGEWVDKDEVERYLAEEEQTDSQLDSSTADGLTAEDSK
jgi:hypothetical protein